MLMGNYGKYKVIHTATEINHHKVIILDHKDNENVNVVVQHTFKGDKTNCGLFHLAEHLLFNNIKLGDEVLSNIQLLNYLKPRGVIVNAATNIDYLRVSATIETPKIHPKMQWTRKYANFENNVGLAIEFINGIHEKKKLEEATLKKEINVVVSELKQYGDDVYREVLANAHMYGSEHNVLGSTDEIKSAKRHIVQNILNHIYSGELLDCIVIKCDMTRHEDIIKRLTKEINIDSSICKISRPRVNSKTGAVTSFGTKIEKFRYSHVCNNIPKGHAKIKCVEPVYLSENIKSLFVGFDFGCNYKKSESILSASKKKFMLDILFRQLTGSSNVGIGYELRENRGLIYGFSGLEVKSEKSSEHHNIPGLTTSISTLASIGITDLSKDNVVEVRDIIYNEILSKLSERYIESVTPAYFENMMRTHILEFARSMNYVDMSSGDMAESIGLYPQNFNTKYREQRLDTISREEYILFAKDVIAKIQWYVIAV